MVAEVVVGLCEMRLREVVSCIGGGRRRGLEVVREV